MPFGEHAGLKYFQLSALRISYCHGKENRGDSPYAFLTDDSALSLALSIFPESYEFDGEEVLKLVEPGLYKRGYRVQQKKSDKAE